MRLTSAGLLMFRTRPGGLEFLLGHPGGPYWTGKDEGAWSIPKGELDPGEAPLDAALREFGEETGRTPEPPFLPLDPITQKSGKTVHAWAFEGDCDPAELVSVTFEMEWPPRSGRRVSFPEIDRFGWFSAEEARRKINPAQAGWIDELEARVA